MTLYLVDTRRVTRKDNPREFSVNVQHETRICGRYEIEEHVSMAFVNPSLHGCRFWKYTEENGNCNTMKALVVCVDFQDMERCHIDTSMPGTIEHSTTRPTTTPTTPTSTTSTTTKSCPHSGYQQYSEFNCYKAFPSYEEQKTWGEAREQCKRDGGDLMLIDSEREREDVYIPLFNSVNFYYRPWVGVYIPQGGNDWTTLKGEPALSTWWAPGQPHKYADRKCAEADTTGLLWNINCTFPRSFICEIAL